jgi:hypothetical protein
MVMNVSKYTQALETYISRFTEYLDDRNSDDVKNNYTIKNDLDKFLREYKGNFQEFDEKEKKKSKLYLAFTESSKKMINIIFNIMNSDGPVIVFSNYVLMEGLAIFKIYLKYFNFYSFMDKKKLIPGKLGYTEFHGQIKEWSDRQLGMKTFNNPENIKGMQIKIMLISPAGTEGLSLFNVRQIHIMEPHWNEVRIEQVIGRGIRLCSHKMLPIKDRHVDVFRYRSIRTLKDKPTTDLYIEDLARTKDRLLQSFLDAMKGAAVDCRLNYNHNKLANEYKCFQFNEQSLFAKQIGPAYKENIYDDLKFDDGFNSTRSNTVRIKTSEITAVIQLDDGKFSKPHQYLYYKESGTVYDPTLHYAIGKIGQDENQIPLKFDENTYIIDQLIPIPIL